MNKDNPFIRKIRDIAADVLQEQGISEKDIEEKIESVFGDKLKEQIFVVLEDKLDEMVEVRVAACMHELLDGAPVKGGKKASEAKQTRKKRPRCEKHECAKRKTKDGDGWECRKCLEG